ncbi:MAG: IS21 family transposase, partial [Planctomycetota bacterium]
RETGIHWTTLEKILSHSEPPGYRRKVPRARPKLDAHLGRIRQILDEDAQLPRKQRHTAKRIFERLRQEGYRGGYTQVKMAVREIRQRRREVFVPLVHRPGQAQFDFGFALIRQRGRLRKVALAVMSLPYSDALIIQAFERICTETLWEGHRRAFEFFGGVPQQITYDNDAVLVAQVLGARSRKLTRGFLQLKSHYLFDSRFCRVRRGNEKGVVEGSVKYARLNFLVPVPEVRELEELNRRLIVACREDLERRLRGQSASKGVLLGEDRAAFLPLPAAPFDACRKVSTTASSLSLVRFDRNDYSVPVRYAHHPVVVKGYVHQVVICHRGRIVARHRRAWGKEGVSFDPVHYLALLERKPGALDEARPLADWELPDCFGVLRRRLEDERGGEGTREYIRVLRLLEQHSLPALTRAVCRALRLKASTRDVIAQYLIPQEDWRQTTFRLDGREQLRQVRVAATEVSAYSSLLAAKEAS